MRILAIDPGSDQSAWLVYETSTLTSPVLQFGIERNGRLLDYIRRNLVGPDVVVIEKIESYGMAVGREVFDTVHWAGRFTEAASPTDVVQLPRLAVKKAICHNGQAKDANIRQALIDRFGGATAIGRKATPGPLYGISKDVWSALAIAVTYAETEGAA